MAVLLLLSAYPLIVRCETFELRVIELSGGSCRLKFRGETVMPATGSLVLPGMTVETGDTGQIRLKSSQFDIRMREDSAISFETEARILLVRGAVGIKTRKSLLIVAPHCETEIASGIAVIKTYDSGEISRVALLKGNASLSSFASGKVPLNPARETAASANEISKAYKINDDLMYMWYW